MTCLILGLTDLTHGFGVLPVPHSQPIQGLQVQDQRQSYTTDFEAGGSGTKDKGKAKGKGPRKVRLEWSKNETFILIDSWQAHYTALKAASNSGKAAIWKKIFDDFRKGCEDDGIEFDKLKMKIRQRRRSKILNLTSRPSLQK